MKKIVNIILKRVYNESLILTSLNKRSLKKNSFSIPFILFLFFNNQLYEQIDGVSMRSSLGPVFASIILTEFESIIVSDLIQSGVIKFYPRYVDDTLVLIRPCDIPFLLSEFNSFDENLKFTIDSCSSSLLVPFGSRLPDLV